MLPKQHSAREGQRQSHVVQSFSIPMKSSSLLRPLVPSPTGKTRDRRVQYVCHQSSGILDQWPFRGVMHIRIPDLMQFFNPVAPSVQEGTIGTQRSRGLETPSLGSSMDVSDPVVFRSSNRNEAQWDQILRQLLS